MWNCNRNGRKEKRDNNVISERQEMEDRTPA